jgi:serine/threonine-protein kinase RsbW
MPETLIARPRRRVFPGRTDQISRARDFTRRALGLCPVLDEAVLLVSELATNAVKHTATGIAGSFSVTICLGETSLLITVKDDGSDRIPHPGRADVLAEDGRGLELVELIADRWGCCGSERGRTVWFALRCKQHSADLGPRRRPAAHRSERPPGRSQRRLPGHHGRKQLLASTGSDGTVRIWDPQTGACLLTTPICYPGMAIAWVAESLAIGLGAGILMIKPRTVG